MGLFSNSPGLIFWTIVGQAQTGFGFGFNPKTDVFGLCSVFWYHSNSVPCFMWVQDLGHFLCYCWKKLNNMLLCVKIMLICACVMMY